MRPTNPNFNYALNENNELIKVESAQRGENYFCPNCNALMIPRMGEKNRWHFAHKIVAECNHESYLHKLAKIKIKEAFKNSSEFFISFNVPAICNNKNCKLKKDENRCACETQVEHDLKRYYDTCEEECTYKTFKADLLLTSSTKQDLEPLLIEIYVTHKSTEEKISDGVRIIEIKIESEEDIDNIVSSKTLFGIRNVKDKSYIDINNKIIFYNFKETVEYRHPEFFDNLAISGRHYYFLWRNDTGYFKYDKCLCYENPLNKIPENTHYLIACTDFSWCWGLLELWKKGVRIPNCEICKYSSNAFDCGLQCNLHRKFNTPLFPKRYEAKTCKYFKLQNDIPQNPLNPVKKDNDFYVGKK